MTPQARGGGRAALIRRATLSPDLTLQVLFLSQCLLVTPKRVVAGALRLTPRQLHFVGDAPAEQAADPPGAEGPRGAGSRSARTHRHWELASIVEVQHPVSGRVPCSGLLQL